MAVATAGTTPSGGTAWWRDPKARGIVVQIVVVASVVGFLWFIVHNTAINLEKRGIATGFQFLSQPAGFDIATSIIPYDATMTHGRVFLVGLLNTILVAVCGIIFATVLGFGIGVLRLSPNWLINKLAYVYIESLRNIPVLLQILFWWAFFLGLPRIKDAVHMFGDTVFLSNRGLQMPWPILGSGFELVSMALVVGIITSIFVGRRAKKRREETGEHFPVVWAAVGLIIGLPLLAFIVTGFPLSWDVPVQKGFNYQGGFAVTPEFTGLLFALSLYHAAFIAENVRSGIQAVSHGQTEAAYALGLRPGWTMRLIILPQALRVIVPPLTSQYMNLAKNSSLAIAVGYPDLVAVFGNTTLNQTGQAIEVIAMTMAVYLALSLTISVFMNWYNKKIALVER
jgi:general L-amino acid transport system permease protein